LPKFHIFLLKNPKEACADGLPHSEH